MPRDSNDTLAFSESRSSVTELSWICSRLISASCRVILSSRAEFSDLNLLTRDSMLWDRLDFRASGDGVP